jgi:hypothetical protein
MSADGLQGTQLFSLIPDRIKGDGFTHAIPSKDMADDKAP